MPQSAAAGGRQEAQAREERPLPPAHRSRDRALLDRRRPAALPRHRAHLTHGTRLKPDIRDKITLRMLANYTSQFPRRPSNIPFKDGKRDPAAYTIEEFKFYLRTTSIPYRRRSGRASCIRRSDSGCSVTY